MPKRSSFRTKWALMGITAVLCVVWLYLYFDSVRQRRRAEQVLSDLIVFPFATADFALVRDITLRHGGGPIRSNLEQVSGTCTPRDCEFEVSILPAETRLLRDQKRFLRALDLTGQYLGFHPWMVTVTFTVRDGSLQHSRTTVEQERIGRSGDYSGRILISYTAHTDRTATPYSHAEYPGSDYAVTRPHVTGGPTDVLQVWTVPKPSGAWKRAFDIHLDCLTAVLRGCVDFRGLAPSAWADYEASRDSAQFGMRGPSQR
jgi:hypothetical protein